MGGFECSTHRDACGRRLDLIASTRHDEFAVQDYSRLMDAGMLTARDGLRWHLIEKEPSVYDFSSLEQQVRAARETGIQVIWDYFHYGYPDDLDIFSPEFVSRFAWFSRAATDYLKAELGDELFVSPVNEISFFAWIAGTQGHFHPGKKRSGGRLKRQLVRTAIASMDAIREIAPDARFVITDPAIHVLPPRASTPSSRRAAEAYRQSQFEAFDMLAGKTEPELGGAPQYLDIVGLNYYFHNQWRHPSRRKVPPGHKDYRPFNDLLAEYYERYKRPILIAETGIEEEKRPEWFRYVAEQAGIARQSRIPVEGICLYPIVNHPGWADDRHCHNGLWDYADNDGNREIFEPLAKEIAALEPHPRLS